MTKKNNPHVRFIRQLVQFLFLWLTNRNSHTFAFARQHPASRRLLRNDQARGFQVALQTRGGGDTVSGKEDATAAASSSSSSLSSSPTSRSLLVAPLMNLGKQYSLALERAPILTKSVTACCIFALSDYLAQRLESNSKSVTESKSKPLDWTRIFTSAAVGLLCFGPGAHAWYNMIFQVFPGTGLLSTLQKAAMGQLFFGPSFTCIFFAASLLQTGQFSLTKWFGKIRRDLPGAWLAGLGFWPLVDLVSYSVVPVQFIPLFVNVCSLVWTIYLSTVANRVARTD